MKFAVVGCGSMGNRRIRYIQHLKAGDIVAYDVRNDRMAAVRGKYSIQTVNSLQELIDFDPAAIFICVPPSEHLFYLNLAVEHGWHFMTEQPISHALDGLEDIVEIVRRKRLVNHVSCNMRFHPAVIKMKQLIANDSIGSVLSGVVEVGEWLPDWHPYEPYIDYYPSKKSMGGGLDAICDLEWLINMFGSVSRMACIAGKRSTLDIDTDDVVQILLEFKSGPQVSLHTDMLQRAFEHKAKFIGEKGTIVCDWVTHKVSLYQPDTKKWRTIEGEVGTVQWESMKMKPGWEWVEPMYLEDSTAFIKRLQSNDSSTVSLQEGIENLQLILQGLACNAQNIVWRNPEWSGK